MALNQEEGFLTRIGFDDGYVLEGSPDENLDDLGDILGLNCGKAKKGSDHIGDLLPQDPFDMDTSTKVTDLTALTGWFEDFGFQTDEIEVSEVDDRLFAELNFVLTDAMRIHQEVGHQKIGESSGLSAMSLGEGLHGGDDLIDGKEEVIMGFSYEKYWIFSDATNKDQGGVNDNCVGDGVVSDAVFLTLGCLGLKDLLSVERVCKSLRDFVRGDTLLWRSIRIDHPLSATTTDDILIKLTDRAQGHLHSLSLVCCSKITDGGLKLVLERNPRLAKLSVPGCRRLTVDGILSNLKVLKSAGKFRLKYLGIYGLSGVTNQHFEEFKNLLGVDNSKLPTTRKPRFFSGHELCVNSDDDRAIDIEICPKCQQLRLVYDCPSECCQKKQSSSQLCRACSICIERCVNCGCCLKNYEYEELFTLDYLCLDCWGQLWGCQEREEGEIFLPNTTVLHKRASYRFYLRG